MALVVKLVASLLPAMPAPMELAVLVSTGGLAYLALVFILRRDMLFEIIDLVIRRRAPPVPSA